MANGTSSSGIRALIIVTSIALQCMYIRIMMSLLFDFVVVDDEDEAMDLLQMDNEFNFMLIDAGRSNSDGEAITSLKELAPDVKIIVSTFEIDLADDVLAAGADEFILKPVQSGDIIVTLMRLGIIG